jgi:hypothetical protein
VISRWASVGSTSSRYATQYERTFSGI